MADNQGQEAPPPEALRLKIVPTPSASLRPGCFADVLRVNHDADMLTLTFFTSPSDIQAILAGGLSAPDSEGQVLLQMEPVAKLIVTPRFARMLQDALRSGVAQWEENREKLQAISKVGSDV